MQKRIKYATTVIFDVYCISPNERMNHSHILETQPAHKSRYIGGSAQSAVR